MQLKKIIPKTLFISWSILGFKRGLEDFDFKYQKKNKKTYLYSQRIAFGIIGTLFYVAPLFICITIPKEIYRLEVNIRGLEDEKKTDYYKEVFP